MVAEADSLIFDRSPNPHLAFGWGAHVCLGAALTNRMFHALFAAFTEHAPNLVLAGTPERKQISTSRALATLPVAFQGAGTR